MCGQSRGRAMSARGHGRGARGPVGWSKPNPCGWIARPVCWIEHAPSPDGAHRRTEGPYPAVIEPRDGLIYVSRSRSANKLVMPSPRRSMGVWIRAI